MIFGVIQEVHIEWGAVMASGWSDDLVGRSDVIIYTRDLCDWCDRAKKEIKARNWNYTEYNISDPTLREELKVKAPDAKTVPQIWVGKDHIGGYDDLMKYFEETLGW